MRALKWFLIVVVVVVVVLVAVWIYLANTVKITM